MAEEEDEPRGLAALRRIGAALADPDRGAALASRPALRRTRSPRPVRLSRRAALPLPWVEELGRQRLLLFGGKGGVGKTTCAAAAALAIAARWPGEPLLLVSTDPAHSLGDVLAAPLGDDERPVPGAPPNLRAREIDAPAALARWRGGHRTALGGVLAGWTGEGDADGADDAAVGTAAEDLLDLVPTGLDELVGVLALVEALFGEEGDEEEGRSEVPETLRRGARKELSPGAPGSAGGYARVVVDTAPTGHALRLLAMPELALAWDHAVLALLLKYREVAPPGALAAELVGLSRRLKRFTALLRNPGVCRFVAVARPAELPAEETARLIAALGEMEITVGALVANAVTPRTLGTMEGGTKEGSERSPSGMRAGGGAGGDCARCGRRAAAEAPHLERLARLAMFAGRAGAAPQGCAMILAPAEFPPPRGARRLGAWGRSWEMDRS